MSANVNDFEEYIRDYLKNVNDLALLLDYDGTLTTIVAHPDLAKVPSETKAILSRLSQNSNIFLAIISGRSVQNVKDLVGIRLEVAYPDGSKYIHQLPSDFNDQVKELIAKLEEKVVRDGAWIENKGASLTFHFRAVPEDMQGNIEEEAQKIIEETKFKVCCLYYSFS